MGSPALRPMRKVNGVSGFFLLYTANAFWMSTEHSTASVTETKEAINPSPVCLTSRPRCVLRELRVSALWIWSKCRALVSPYSVVISVESCLLYTSDAADERSSVDLGG